MDLFENWDPGELLLFVCNFNMILDVSDILMAGTKIQYLCTLVRGEVLRQFDALYAEVESAIPETLSYII